MRYYYTILIIAIMLFNSIKSEKFQDEIYGIIKPEDYLIGKFDPSKHNDLFTLVKGIDTNYPMYLRNDAYKSFMKMYHDFSNETGITFHLISALRNYTSQHTIWNNKWNGEYKKIPDPINRALGILEWSSMPGTSRHHWGTDFDLYSLSNEDFNKGKGAIIYKWFEKNAYKYGFCQPYTENRCAGYNLEKWHWSYYPVSKVLLKDWNRLYGSESICKFMERVDFDGKKAGILATTYVNTINPLCR